MKTTSNSSLLTNCVGCVVGDSEYGKCTPPSPPPGLRGVILNAKRNTYFSRALLFLAALAVTMILLFPAILALGTSFKPMGEIFTMTPTIFPLEPTLASYQKILSMPEFSRYLMNSLIIAGLTALIAVIASLLAAYALTFLRFPGRKSVSQMILMTYMFPSVTLVIPFYFLACRLDLLDTHGILILADLSFALPIAVWLMNGYFEKFPIELVKAARIDGCGPLRIIHHVILPIMTPGITAAGVFAFILAWSEYLFSLTLTLTDASRTVSAGMHYCLMGNYRTDYGLLTAAGIIMVIPVVILFALFQKYIVGGLTEGSLK